MFKHEPAKFTRREALAATIGAIGVTWLGGSEALAEPAPSAKSDIKIGCSTVNFRTISLREAMTRIRRAGYEWFEPQATGSWCPHIDVEKDDPQAFRRLVKEYGFKGATAMWTLHGAIVADPKSVEGISRSIRWAKEAGIPAVNAGDGVKPDGMSEADALAILRDRIGKIVEVAEQCRVYLAIEPHGTFSLTADGLRKLMGLTTSKWLGINYDTANVHRATYAKGAPGAYAYQLVGQRQDEVAALRAVVDRVVHVHVKDVLGARCTALGDGTVNVSGCLNVLKQHKYQGVVSLETEAEYKPEQMQQLIERSRAYVLRVLGQ